MSSAKWPRLADIVAAVNSGDSSAESNVTKAIVAIKEAEKFNAVLEIVEGRSLKRAKEIDAKAAAGEPVGRLAGVPFIAKDNYLTFDSETTASSNILKGFKAPYQSEIVERLESEGAILVGKANLDSFAHGSSTENSDMGPTKNPHDPTRVPGGSSGGSAAAVALGLTPFALGSDTGGSIRLPASFTGTVGYKPTYGLTSRYGVIAMAASTDVMGPIATNIQDTALLLDIMSGQDDKDGTTIKPAESDYTKIEKDVTGLKVGVVKEHLGEGVSDDVKANVLATIDRLKAGGADVQEISMPILDAALACYYVVMPAEVSSNLGRYDGIRFGFHSENAKTIDEVYDQSRSAGFNSEVKRRVMLGTYVLSSGYYDAYYKKAQQVRTLLIEAFDKAFEDVDVMVGPVSPTTAFKLGEHTHDPLSMYLTDIMTVGMNLTGAPAISLPIEPDRSGLPIGFHISANRNQDLKVLEVANWLEGELVK